MMTDPLPKFPEGDFPRGDDSQRDSSLGGRARDGLGHDVAVGLSAQALARREQILAAARRVARGRRHRRLAGMAAGTVGAAAVALACGVVALRLNHAGTRGGERTQVAHSGATPPARGSSGQSAAPPGTSSGTFAGVGPRPGRGVVVPPRHRPTEVVITRVETDSDLVRRLAVPPQTPTWQRLSDDELLRRLSEAGRPAGLAYVEGRAMLLYRQSRDQ